MDNFNMMVMVVRKVIVKTSFLRRRLNWCLRSISISFLTKWSNWQTTLWRRFHFFEVSVFMSEVLSELFLSRIEFILLLFQELKFLLLVVKSKIIKELGCRFESAEDVEHPLAHFWKDFLTVSSLTSWFVLVQGILKVDELEVGNILDVQPLDLN